jgi:cytochrome c peroxidase
MKTLNPRKRITTTALLASVSFWGLASSYVLGLGPVLAAGSQESVSSLELGEDLFNQEDFGGNGRSCGSCHRGDLRSITPDEAKTLFAENPDAPLFSHDVVDNFGALANQATCLKGDKRDCQNGYQRFLRHATVGVAIDLHPNVRVLGKGRTVVVNRGIPSTVDIALESVMMSDGRVNTLEAQAADAAITHSQATKVEPDIIDAIVAFETSEFSSPKLAIYAQSGVVPVLPQGSTASEKRGREFFLTPEKKGKFGFCGMCHSGPMLNEMAIDILLPPPLTETSPGLEARKGDRFITALVSEANSMANKPLLWVVEEKGATRMILSPD